MALERKLRLVKPYAEETKMEAAVKVAFATSDMRQVDQHFGAAACFVLYSLDPEQATLTEAVQFSQLTMEGPPDSRRNEPGEPANAFPAQHSGSWAGQSGAPVTHQRSQPRAAVPLFDAPGHYEDKLVAKMAALDGCIAVYCQAVGASAVNQLRAKGIQAVKVSPGSDIQGLIEALQEELRAGPTAWLARAIEQQKPRNSTRFEDMEQEGWIE